MGLAVIDHKIAERLPAFDSDLPDKALARLRLPWPLSAERTLLCAAGSASRSRSWPLVQIRMVLSVFQSTSIAVRICVLATCIRVTRNVRLPS